MPIHTKKAAVRNREVSINNQIASIFVNNNGAVSINQDAVPKYESKTATTSLAISGTYRIPLVSASSGVQGLNTSANLVYDTNTNTLQVQNLTTIYSPQCSVVPTQPTQLVNKAYLDQYVGDYKQQWIYDDWLTGDVSGSLNWRFSKGGVDVAGLQSLYFKVIPSEPGHPGIVRIERPAGDAFTNIRINNNIRFTSNMIKCVRFMVRPFALNLNDISGIETTFIQMYLGNFTTLGPLNNDYSNSAHWNFRSNVVFGINDEINWTCHVKNRDNSKAESPYKGTLANKWVLFEIELNNQKPSFYITVMGETNRTLVYEELTETINSSVFIEPYIVNARISNNKTKSPQSFYGPSLDIDYVDILYNKL